MARRDGAEWRGVTWRGVALIAVTKGALWALTSRCAPGEGGLFLGRVALIVNLGYCPVSAGPLESVCEHSCAGGGDLEMTFSFLQKSVDGKRSPKYN